MKRRSLVAQAAGACPESAHRHRSGRRPSLPWGPWLPQRREANSGPDNRPPPTKPSPCGSFLSLTLPPPPPLLPPLVSYSGILKKVFFNEKNTQLSTFPPTHLSGTRRSWTVSGFNLLQPLSSLTRAVLPPSVTFPHRASSGVVPSRRDGVFAEASLLPLFRRRAAFPDGMGDECSPSPAP